MKEVRGFTSRVNFPKFEVLKNLQNGLSITEISKYRKVSRVSIYKTLSSLVKNGMVSKVSRGVYKLTEEGIKGLHSFVAFRYKLRQHNLGIKIDILESPKNWELKRNEIRQMPYFNKSIKLKNNEQDLINFGRFTVRTTTKSLIIKMPTIYDKDWEGAIVQAMALLEEIIPKLEHQFKVKLVKEYKSNMKIISQEYARIQDALAKLYRHEGNRIYLTGDDGKIWLITDFSFSEDELELIHTERSPEDLNAIAPFLNDLRNNPTTFSQERELMKEKMQLVDNLIHNEVKHQRVLDEILLTFKKINDRLDKAGL